MLIGSPWDWKEELQACLTEPRESQVLSLREAKELQLPVQLEVKIKKNQDRG